MTTFKATVKITIDLPINLKPLYDDMVAHGCRLAVEVLTTREVSVTISDTETGDDRDISVTPNGPKSNDGICAMLQREAWKTAATVLGEN